MKRKLFLFTFLLFAIICAKGQTAGYILKYNQKGGYENSRLYERLSSPYNIGIGTASPRTTLEVKSIDAPSVFSIANEFTKGSIITADMDFYINGLNKPTAYPRGKIGYVFDGSGKQPGALYFGTGDGSAIKERMRITEKGNIGIGTNSPSARFDVVSEGGTIARFSSATHSSSIEIGSDDSGISFSSKGGTIFRTNDSDNLEHNGEINVGVTIRGNYPNSYLKVNSNSNNSIARLYNSQSPGGFEIATDTDRLILRSWYGGKGIELSTAKSIADDPVAGIIANFNRNQLYLKENGNVGIGTSTPASPLHVESNAGGSSLARFTANSNSSSLEIGVSSGEASVFNSKNGHGLALASTSSAGTRNASQLYLKENGNVGINTSNPTTSLEINNGTLKLSGTTFNGQGPARIVVETGASTAHDFILFQNDNGKQFFVSHAGTVFAKEVNVVASTAFPDYVFEDDYNLMPLSEVESHITEYKHLPNVPSASEINETGVNLGEMDRILLEKIEELTLYIIEQQKRIDQQQEMIEELRMRECED